ncbi:hypothetical protein EVAR_68844_1 [Eumeta japonica]|uniref:DUF8207 domain-containing protein n=1 Tax=Eumeta variegata TaxID=151549 RepID=A0A4C1SQS1_EUMVA|nr:hypothetical protein EVAR_67678_1 [Eumeta japonica]GBP98539.1 hypothetical protein EVAR_68844_1 [Eumeta japonica]
MNERILKELVTTRNVLKKKLRSIKTGEIESREQLTDTFKPITEPLKEFLNNSKHADRLVKKEESDMKTEAKDDKSIDLRKSSIKLETSTPRKLFEEDTIVNQSSNASGSDNEDEFYSQTSNTEDSFSNLSLLEVRNELDTNYGPHKDLNNKWKFGNSHIDFDQDKIQVGGQIWALTPGLFSLMFHKTPRNYDKSELEIYKKILTSTNAYRRDYKPDGQIKGTKAYKYKHIIQKLFKEEKQKKSPESVLHAPKANYLGGGTMQLNPHKPNYIYWDDPNELVDRLRLLIASQAAGHSNHNNEIVSIIEELREANIIV